MQDASSKQQNKNKNTNPIISIQDYHFTQPCPSEEKQTNKQQKLSTNLTLYEAYPQTTGPNLEGRSQKEERIQP